MSVIDLGAQKSAIVTATFSEKDATTISESLKKLDINTSVCTRYSAVIDFDHRKIESALRISPHYYNTEEEIEDLVSSLAQLLNQP